MIHISDITREKRLNHPREALTAGQKVRAVVLELDQERRRIKLGIKQLEPTTADEYIGEHQAGETVTGRIVETGRGQAKVELGEGVFAECRLPERAAEVPAAAPQPDRVCRSIFVNRHAFSQVEAGLVDSEIRRAGAGARRSDPHFPHPEAGPGRQEN